MEQRGFQRGVRWAQILNTTRRLTLRLKKIPLLTHVHVWTSCFSWTLLINEVIQQHSLTHSLAHCLKLLSAHHTRHSHNIPLIKILPPQHRIVKCRSVSHISIGQCNSVTVWQRGSTPTATSSTKQRSKISTKKKTRKT